MSAQEFDNPCDNELFCVADRVIVQVNEMTKQDKVCQALFCLLWRNFLTWRTIQTIRTHASPAELSLLDVAVLIRCMFDAYLQADFIYRDPSKREERAKLYLDYQFVDRLNATVKTLRHHNGLSRRLGQSKLREEGEKPIREAYDRVKSQFIKGQPPTDGSEPELRTKWYKENLGQLATTLGRKDEYDTFVSPYSGCVHSSSYPLTSGPSGTHDVFAMFATTLVARVLDMLIVHTGISISEIERENLNALKDDLLKDDMLEPPQS
jgi:Family of unknown function (DUF5677)